MQRSCQHHRGFTLVEVMISVAIALLLIIGVNSVFKATAQTVGAGESLLSAARDSRTVLQTMLADLNYVDSVPAAGSTTGDAPFFIIRSEHCYAFRNLIDQQSASNPTDPSQDTTLYSNVAVFPSNRVPVPMLNTRSHRIDRLGFFARGLFTRQTSSNNTAYVSTASSPEAWIVYGQAQQPNKGLVNPAAGSGGWCDPGDPSPKTGKNDYNYVACDWLLSRMAMVLVPGNYSTLYNNSTKNPSTYDPTYSQDYGDYIADDQASDLTPLSTNASAGTQASVAAVSGGLITSSRLDLANTSIATYNASANVRPGGINSYSWGTNPATNSGYANFGKDWWTPILGGWRYQASPFILAGTTIPKITPATLATCSPDLIRGCSSFVVEYAGNFYTKKSDGSGAAAANLPNGQPQTVPTPDPTGQLDFYLDANTPPVQHIRWYGFPRSTTGPNAPNSQLSGAPYVSPAVSATSGDVVPLRDVLAYLNSGWAGYADAERFSGTFPMVNPNPPTNYWTAMPGSTSENQAATRYTYTAAWGPDVHYMAFPKMVRIIIEVDDRENRLKQPQVYEFIYDLLP